MADNNYYLAPKPFPYDPASQSRHMDDLRGWAGEVVQQGRAYLRQQPAYRFIQQGLDIVNGDFDRVSNSALSDAQTAATLRAMKELNAAQTNLRIIPAFSTEHRDYTDTTIKLNKMNMGWQGMTFADRSIRKVWQYATACGTGYAGMRWDSNYWRRGKGEQVIDAYGPDSVLPIGLPHSHDIQKAYCVALCIPTPVHEVFRKWSKYKHLIKPQMGPSISGRGGGGIVGRGMELATAALRFVATGSVKVQEPVTWPTVDIYYLYIDDDSVNDGTEPVLMGEPGTTWEYTVPYIGQEIPRGFDSEGKQLYRRAEETDCLLYPNRRLIVFAGSGGAIDCCLTPNPQEQVNPYTHGQVPLVQFRADDWPWSFLGFPLSKSTAPLERSMGGILRAFVDATNVSLNPATKYDRDTMSDAAAREINTRLPGQRVPISMMMGGKDQLSPLLPPGYTNPQPLTLEFMKQCEGWIKEWIGSGDAAALARARQLPSGDSTERLLEAMGPLIKDMSRNMELSITQMGNIWLSNAYQFYTAGYRFELLGIQGIQDEDVDWDPGNMVPDRIEGVGPSYYERARHVVHRIKYKVHPYSIHELQSMSRRLFLLQLFRSGFPIDPWTLSEAMDIHDFGAKPMMPDPNSEGGERECQTMMEKWLAWEQIKAKIAAAMAAGQQHATGGEGGGGGGGPKGRPPTAQNPPSLTMKDAGGRSTIRESKK